jgi:hypothetical protein
MNNYIFIDRFFESQFELLDLARKEDRDVNTLYTFLNNLHTTGDRLKEDFNCDIKKYPEFKLLRIIRNYFHHVNDIKEIRLSVISQPGVIVSHSEHLIISLADLAKALKSFLDNNSLPKTNKNYKKKKKFIDDEIRTISDIFSYIYDIVDKLDYLCENPFVEIDGEVHEAGFDMFKFVYNITNIVADKCREIGPLKNKPIILDLEETYTSEFNISKRDVVCYPNRIPLLTTKGFIYLP